MDKFRFLVPPQRKNTIPARDLKRLLKSLTKKQGKEANKAYLNDRYGYLRKSTPKTKHTSDK